VPIGVIQHDLPEEVFLASQATLRWHLYFWGMYLFQYGNLTK
jgi:hypothetical protein